MLCSENEMNASPIGLSTGCFYTSEIDQALLDIRDGGFDLVEICFSPDRLDYHDLSSVKHVRARLGELGLEAYSMHENFPPFCDLSSPDPTQRRRSLDEVLAAAYAASLLEVRCFVIHPGLDTMLLPDDSTFVQRTKIAADTLTVLAERCRALGMECLFENRDAGHLFGATNEILRILVSMENSAAGACLDTGYESRDGGLRSIFPTMNGRLGLIHAHDSNLRGAKHLPPGDGTIDWRGILVDFRQNGFDKPIILEIADSGTPKITMSNARRGRAFLKANYRWLALSGY